MSLASLFSAIMSVFFRWQIICYLCGGKIRSLTITKGRNMEDIKTNIEETPAAETPAQEEKKEEKKGLLKKGGKDKAKIEELEKKVAELEEKAAKDKDDYIRLMAEFDNFRRRTSQEKIELISMASTETIKGMLPVLDDCERALAVLKDSDDSNAAKEGTELIYHKLMGYLQSKGLAVIEAQFPVPEEEMKGKVFDVVQTGYTLNGKVIRFAKVVVGI